MERVAALAGVSVEYRVLPDWQAVLDAVRDGRAHMIPNLGITEQRSRDFIFTAPVETFNISIFVRDGTSAIAGANDLRGRIVGTIEANAAVRLLSRKPAVRLRIFPTLEEALIHLLAGQIDAIAYPEPALTRIAGQAGLADKIQVVGEPLREIKRAIAVRKDAPALAQRLDRAVSRFVESEEYRTLYAKWHARPRGFWTVPRVAWTMGVLIMGTVIVLVGWRFFSVTRLNTELRERIVERDRLREVGRGERDEVSRPDRGFHPGHPRHSRSQGAVRQSGLRQDSRLRVPG